MKTIEELTKMVTKEKSKKMVEKCSREWGNHIIIHDDKDLRELVAEATAKRLGLSPTFTKMRFNSLFRLGKYYESSLHRRRSLKT